MKELTYVPGVIGREVKDGPSPERVAAVREGELERARRIAPEAPFSDFDISQTGPSKWSFIDKATGTEFRRVEGLVLDDPDSVSVGRSNIACFTVDAAGTIHFLRPRGMSDSPSSSVLHGQVYGRRLA